MSLKVTHSIERKVLPTIIIGLQVRLGSLPMLPIKQYYCRVKESHLVYYKPRPYHTNESHKPKHNDNCESNRAGSKKFSSSKMPIAIYAKVKQGFY